MSRTSIITVFRPDAAGNSNGRGRSGPPTLHRPGGRSKRARSAFAEFRRAAIGYPTLITTHRCPCTARESPSHRLSCAIDAGNSCGYLSAQQYANPECDGRIRVAPAPRALTLTSTRAGDEACFMCHRRWVCPARRWRRPFNAGAARRVYVRLVRRRTCLGKVPGQERRARIENYMGCPTCNLLGRPTSLVAWRRCAGP